MRYFVPLGVLLTAWLIQVLACTCLGIGNPYDARSEP